MDRSEVINSLARLALPRGHWAVHASAVLVLHGLVDEAADVDVIARGPAWQQALGIGEPKPGKMDLCVAVPHLNVEIWSGWLDEDVDQLLDTAEEVSGVPCVSLTAVLRFKEVAGRPKDAAHVAALRHHLGLEH